MSRRHPWRVVASALAIGGLATALACADSPSGPRAPVVASVDVEGLPDSVGVGDVLFLSARARDAEGRLLSGVVARWRSLAPAVADVDSTGLLRGVSQGNASLVVTTRGRTLREDTVVARVRRLPRRFIFGDVPDSIFVGARDTLTVEVQDGDGRPLGPVVEWSSSDTSVMRVDSLGIVSPVNRGIAWIRAGAGDRADSVRVRGEFQEFMPGRPYVDISAGSGWAPCAVTAGGQVWCAGSVAGGSPLLAFHVPGAAVMRSVEGGQSQSCGLAADSTLYCWGTNANRVFGTVASTGGIPHDTLYPGGLRMKWRQFTLGDQQQACGIAAADSVVYCWGHNDTQQVGRAPARPVDSLVAPFATPLRAKQVDLSAFHGCAVALDDALWCWGTPSAYGIRTGTAGDDGLPARVQPPGSFAQAATGDQFTCARTQLGHASCWGEINGRVLTTTPVAVAGGARYVEIFTGLSSTACGITAERALHCWNVQDAVMTPRVLMPGRQFVTVALGLRRCALSTEGKLYCW